MGKMSEIAMLLEKGDEKGLVEFFGKQGWRKSVSEIGGKEFLKAFDESKKEDLSLLLTLKLTFKLEVSVCILGSWMVKLPDS